MPGRPAKTIACARCGEQRRNARQGQCNRCSLADPDRPFRYSTAMARRLHPVPAWWDDLTAFTAARHHPSGAIVILREAGRLLSADPGASPQQLLDRCAPATGTAGRALRAFFTSRGLTLPGDEKQRRAAARRRRHLDAVPDCLVTAVAAFNRSQLAEQERARRGGRHPLSDITLETRLRILRDLAVHLTSAGPVTGWSQVATADLEGFLSRSPGNRHQRTYVLRGFFGWAKHRKLILIDPATALRLGSQPGFTGTVLDAAAQRALFRRWTGSTAHPHERLGGLLALLHAASSAQIRSLTIDDADHAQRTLSLGSRPFPTPLDPVSWTALSECLRHREALHTLNPHVIVTMATRTGNSPAHQSYLTRILRRAGTTPALCRQTRVSQLVTDLDPKLAATALGMQDSGLVRYLAGNVDNDRLERTPSIGQLTRALQAAPCTP